MSPIASSLPHPAHVAAQNALAAALNDPSSKPPPPSKLSVSTSDTANASHAQPEEKEGTGTPLDGEDGGEGSDGQEVDVSSSGRTLPLIDTPRTVFEDPMTFNVKHPLYASWTLWFDSPQTKNKSGGAPSTPLTAVTPQTPSQAHGWMDDIKRVINFDSVEEFWGLYNNIVPPSQLPQKANYYLFKENIIPAWEDDANKHGGKWSIQLPRDKNRLTVDKMWLFTMLAAIGETFDPIFAAQCNNDPDNPPSTPKTAPPQSLITGVIVSTRPQFYRLSIWTRLAPSSSSANNTPSTPHSNGHGKALTSNGFSPELPPHPSEEGDALRERIEAIGKHFKTGVLGYAEGAKLGGPLATEVEFLSHKESEKKGRGKKWVV